MMHSFYFIESLSIPSVTIEEVTPTTFQASWESINHPVDEWVVVLKQVQDDGYVSYPESEEELITISVSFDYFRVNVLSNTAFHGR